MYFLLNFIKTEFIEHGRGQCETWRKCCGIYYSREDTGVVTFNLFGKKGDEFIGKAICASY